MSSEEEQEQQKEIITLSEPELEKLLEDWDSFSEEKQRNTFSAIDRRNAEEIFLRLSGHAQAVLLSTIQENDRKSWVRMLAPDDAADLIQELPEDERHPVLDLLDYQTRMDVLGLLAYKEDVAGGLMNPRYARLRPSMTVDEALRYLREQTRSQVETIYYAYVLDHNQMLVGAASLRELFNSPSTKKVEEVMTPKDQVGYVTENQTQEEIAKAFSNKEYRTMPVLNAEGVMKGIITIDDVVQVVQEEATEDFQKIGGMEALDDPYFKVSLVDMIKKRAGWLLVLFIGEMFTTTAMRHYEHAIEKAVVLALFVPLIVSSGGNSGSQATTLIIRAMALGEVRLRDWWRVFLRESIAGLSLGLILGIVGAARIFFWPSREALYGIHYAEISLAVGLSLIGIVTWGSLIGSMLPMVLRRLGFDPAAASAPFVATLVDVTGLVMYFSIASVVLHGTLL